MSIPFRKSRTAHRCEGPDSRPLVDVTKLADHFVGSPQSAYTEDSEGPCTLEGFTFVVRESVLIILEFNTPLIRVARARTGQGRSMFTLEQTEANARVRKGRCDRACKYLIMETRTIKLSIILGACCFHVRHKKCLATLFGWGPEAVGKGKGRG